MKNIKTLYKNYIKNKNIKKKLLLPKFINIDILIKNLNINKNLLIKIFKLFKFKYKKIINNKILLLILDYMGLLIFKKFYKKNTYLKKINYLYKNYKEKSILITLIGHVDSGKTTIIKNLLNKNIKENDNITQNVNFYKYRKNIFLIDTPGHEDFINFRKMGIKITDLIILLISSNDCLNNWKNLIKYIINLKKPTILLFNKTDIYNLKIKYIINELLNKNFLKKENLNKIFFLKNNIYNKNSLKNIINKILNFQITLNLKLNYKNFFTGIIIEKKLFKNCGILSTILIKSGLIKLNDIIIYNNNYYKIKYILNIENKFIKSSKKNILVKLSGLSNSIKSGDIINKLNNIKLIKKLLITKKKKTIIIYNNKNINVIEDIKNIKQICKNIINIILIINNENTFISIKNNLNKLSDKYIKINILNYNINGLNKNIIKTAMETKSYILSFKYKKINKKLINNNKIKFKQFESIYKLNKYINLIKINIIKQKKLIGKALVNKIFILQNTSIAGCKIIKGVVKSKSKIKIIRNNFTYKGEIESLNYFNNQVNIVEKGSNCGIKFKNFNNILEGDIIYIYNE